MTEDLLPETEIVKILRKNLTEIIAENLYELKLKRL